MDIEIQYTDSYVAFIDVLGFKEILSNTELIERFYNTVIGLKALLSTSDEFGSLGRKVSFHMLSDAVIISIPAEEKLNALSVLCYICCRIQVGLAKINIWTRGAISSGGFYFNDENNVVVGKGLANAYVLESQFARVPRIILDPKILNELDLTRQKIYELLRIDLKEKSPSLIFSINYDHLTVTRIEKDSIFLDYIGEYLLSLKERDGVSSLERKDETLRVLHSNLKKEMYSNQSVINKYIWVQQYILNVLDNHNAHSVVDSDWVDHWKELFSEL